MLGSKEGNRPYAGDWPYRKQTLIPRFLVHMWEGQCVSWPCCGWRADSPAASDEATGAVWAAGDEQGRQRNQQLDGPLAGRRVMLQTCSS